MRAVNLLPRDLERRRGAGGRSPLFVAAGGVVVTTAVAAVLFVSASGSISDQQSQLAALEAAIASVPRTGNPVVVPSAIAQERADRVAALSAALTTRVPLDRLLRELAYVLPEDAWLTGLTAAGAAVGSPGSATAGSSADATGGAGVTIQGATYSNRSVARVLARLAALSSLEDVKLGTVARVEQSKAEPAATTAKKAKKAKKQRQLVAFTIAATLRSGGGS